MAENFLRALRQKNLVQFDGGSMEKYKCERAMTRIRVTKGAGGDFGFA
jgi:hypothetical protein